MVQSWSRFITTGKQKSDWSREWRKRKLFQKVFEQAISDYEQSHRFIAIQTLVAILYYCIWLFGSFRLFFDIIISILMLAFLIKTQWEKVLKWVTTKQVITANSHKKSEYSLFITDKYCYLLLWKILTTCQIPNGWKYFIFFQK